MMLTAITSHLDHELIPIGFRRKKATWNRESQGIVEVIDIQISKSGDRVTMNAGVLPRPVYAMCWGYKAKPFVLEPECVVRARVGRLIDNMDRWFRVDDPTTADQLAGFLVPHVLPYLVRIRSLEGMRDQLASEGVLQGKYPLPAIYFAVLQYSLGDISGACQVLSGLESTTPSWNTRVREVAARIGCTSSPTE